MNGIIYFFETDVATIMKVKSIQKLKYPVGYLKLTIIYMENETLTQNLHRAFILIFIDF